MAEVDPDAKWLQMTWVFYFDRKHWTNERIKSMVRSVPQDKMILLDYYCENKEVWQMTEKFFDQPYIWCYLGNFGGNTMIAGNLKTVEERIENTFKNGGDKVWGIGSTLEALDVNPMMYEFLFEKAWTDGPTDIESWISNYASSRCGSKDDNFLKAWDILSKDVYTSAAQLGQGTLTNSRPDFRGNGNWTTRPGIKYDNRQLLKAWDLLLQSKKKDRDSYELDLVNVARQALSNHFKVLRDKFTMAYDVKDKVKAEQIGLEMLDLLDDLENLLATRTDFMLGKWLEDAKSFAVNAEEVKYYETNARTLLATWGVKGQSLNDYANRTWAGMTKGYYRKRWEMFIYGVVAAMSKGKDFDEVKFKEEVTTFEWLWTKQNELYRADETGDSLKVATDLYSKYAKSIHHAQSSNGTQLAIWNPSVITPNFLEHKVELGKNLNAAGNYIVIFKYTKGGNAAIMKDLELLEDGKVVATDKHQGFTGFKHKDNIFKLQLKNFKPGARYQLRIKLRADGGKDSTGQILFFKTNK